METIFYDKIYVNGCTPDVLNKYLATLEPDGKGCILFVFAPWCGACVSTLPIYNKLIENLTAKFEIPVLWVDGNQYTADLTDLGADATPLMHVVKSVSGFPLIFFVRGVQCSTQYLGSRQESMIQSAFTTFMNTEKNHFNIKKKQNS